MLPIGIDQTAGRHAEVELQVCKACGSHWLRYHVEQEAFSNSGRWYRGLISPETAASVTPERAVEVLRALPWRFEGGSFFGSTGRRATTALDPDLL